MSWLGNFKKKLHVLQSISPKDVLGILRSFEDFLLEEIKGKDHGLYERFKGLVKIKATKLAVVGDIHGDLGSLREITGKLDEKLYGSEEAVTVFLGDYVDRGIESFETIMSIIMLKLEEPEKIVMLRGNHEPPENLIPYPHDFPFFLKMRFKNSWKEIYEHFFNIFQLLPIAAYVESKLFLVHGGIPVNTPSLKELALASEKPKLLEELLWNDPSDFIDEWMPSPRGAGKLFGINVTKKFIKQNNFVGIIRSHEPCNGFKLNHKGLVLTVFSRKGYPYFNRYGSIVVINTNELKNMQYVVNHVVVF